MTDSELTAENDLPTEVQIARLITASIAGRRWRDMTPLDVAQYLAAHGVRVTPPRNRA